MRQIGKLEQQSHAERFVDHLLTLGIEAKTDPAAELWAIWIFNENHIQQAKNELEIFRTDPENSRYEQAGSEAKMIRKLEHLKNKERQKNVHNMRGQFRTPGQFSFSSSPVTATFLILTIGFMLIVFFMRETAEGELGLGTYLYAYSLFADPREEATVTQEKDPLISIKRGEVWRAITPIFPHSIRSPLHLLFNMIWLYILGRRMESYLGSIRFLLLFLLYALGSNFAEAYCQTYFYPEYVGFVGMSGVNYGLFGFLWMKTQYEPDPLTFLPPMTIFLMLLWFVVCWTGMVGNVANYAHTGGLVLGVISGGLPHWLEKR